MSKKIHWDKWDKKRSNRDVGYLLYKTRGRNKNIFKYKSIILHIELLNYWKIIEYTTKNNKREKSNRNIIHTN